MKRKACYKISLDDTIIELEPVPVSLGGGLIEEEFDTLENILKAFNDRFGDYNWGEPDKVQEIPKSIIEDKTIIETMVNSSRQNAKDASDKKVKEIIQKFIFANTEIFKTYMNNKESFQNRYNEYIFDMLMEEAKKCAKENTYSSDKEELLAAQPKPDYN